MVKFRSIKTQLIIFLACFALFLGIKDKDTLFLSAVLVAVVSALAAESAVLYLKIKVFRLTESAVISGLIIGFVLSSDEAWWRLVLASITAVLSKHLIRFHKRQVFNPAAFGIFLSIILFGASTQWKGTYFWYLLMPLGLYFAGRLKKTGILAGYALVSLLLFGSLAFLHKVVLWDLPGYFSYFYIFVMVIEPKTTPLKTTGKYIFGAGTAALIFILTEAGMKFDVELFSLLAMNATVPLLNNLFPKKGD